jgi:hypothetical protein
LLADLEFGSTNTSGGWRMPMNCLPTILVPVIGGAGCTHGTTGIAVSLSAGVQVEMALAPPKWHGLSGN